MCGLIGFSSKVNYENKDVLNHRGPDNNTVIQTDKYTFIFNRLSIIDLSDKGNQPFETNSTILMCNGEIYNYKSIKKDYMGFNYTSDSDCEVLVPLYESIGKDMCRLLDAEFALVLFDKKENEIFAARDPIGIRPLFYGFHNGKIAFASEVKALLGYCEDVTPFPPGHYYWKGEFVRYNDLTKVETYTESLDILPQIRGKLIEGVKKRLTSDAPMGFLLSGGLDSSLVCAIAARLSDKPIVTFSTGMTTDPIDTKYARIVADHIGSIHHEFLFTKDQVLGSLEKVIWHLETWDITTIRASIGMYLICEYIKKNTDVKVLLTGEISDELFGYKYTDFAPSPEEFQKEAEKRINELYMYDVLRADRCIAANSLEARVPFGDLDFVNYVMGIHPSLKMKHPDKMGKFLLRMAFELTEKELKTGQGPWLPKEILWREKAAFSDAVGHSMVDYIKEYADANVSDLELEQAKWLYPMGTPFTKESYLYRKIFESFFPNKGKLIKDFWMPNPTWPNCKVSDPSARVLSNYGKSGE